MNIDEVKRTIRQGSLAAQEAKKILVTVGTEAAEAEQLARLTVHDSRDDDAQAGLKILEDFGREVDLTVRRIDAAVEHADAYLATLG
ncbi:hypothetical protein [Plantactinospora endophytica]|uniref:Uncharacterized protein n=1 Tax=Plantactinospora endophytica TaxID=673535 RepID=A0ABQ4DVC2_9ACTN|nr:hypothetical protein [Plantactinospora endophytica]GIG86412.1 hypothetical protein Pen02_13480 [Plantactinospora endophytica]